MSHYDESPINPLPPAVMVLVLAMVLPELAFQAGSSGLIGGPDAVGWRVQALEQFAFYPEWFDWMVTRGIWAPEQLLRIVSYPFVHATFLGTVFAIVFTLALGKMVGEAISNIAVFVLFMGSAIAGALIYWIVLADTFPLFGGMTGAYGLIGGYTFLLWLRQVATGGSQYQAFTLIAFLMGVQLLFGLFFDTGNSWFAELMGFFAGFALSFVMIPGGVKRILSMLRGR